MITTDPSAVIAKLIKENESLRQSIERLGEMANVCTYNDIGKVCSYCECKRKAKRMDK